MYSIVEVCDAYKRLVFFFQAGNGIRGPLWSRGLGDVYKGQRPFRVVQVRQIVAVPVRAPVLRSRAVITDSRVVRSHHETHEQIRHLSLCNAHTRGFFESEPRGGAGSGQFRAGQY